MAMKRLFVSVGFAVLACSTGRTEAESADDVAGSDGSTSGRGGQCLEDAATPIAVPSNAPQRIEVKQILVRHADLRDPKGASQSRQAACLRALEALDALKSGHVEWATAVEKYSDAKDDDLGRVSVDDLDPAFAGAAFSLEVDQLSYVVETPRGFHVILRER